MDPSETRVAVNIVVWNSLAYLPALFKTLDEQTIPLRITVVDNASTDGSGAWVAANNPRVGMLRNMRNYGFARAHNQAILLALASWQDADLAHRYIAVCNPDVELDPQCLEQLYAYLEAHPEVDACQPKLLRAHLKYSDADNKLTVRTRTLDVTGLSFSRALRAFDRGAGEEDRGQYDQSPDVFGVSGTLAMYRASSVQRASLDQQFFDEDFFAYQEDADVSWRMRHLGMRAAYVPSAAAWHHRLAPSLERDSWFKAWQRRRSRPSFVNYLSTRNHCWVLLKNLTFREKLHCLLWLLPYEAAKAVAALGSWSALRGYFSAIAGLPRMWRKRRVLKKNRLASFKNLSAWFV